MAAAAVDTQQAVVLAHELKKASEVDRLRQWQAEENKQGLRVKTAAAFSRLFTKQNDSPSAGYEIELDIKNERGTPATDGGAPCSPPATA